MTEKINEIISKNMHMTNIITGCLGVILILTAVIIGVTKTLSVILLSIGTSVLASAIVSYLNSKYLINRSEAIQMVERWGIEKIYTARSEINVETNDLLKSTNRLEICAMGLKGFRDAQAKTIEKRVSEGMKLKILTLNPNSKFLSNIDQKERSLIGSTKNDIESLLTWISELKNIQRVDGQVEVKTYDNYPYDFYFNLDGTIFVGPYQNKTSQQTITYKYAAGTKGAKIYKDYFDSLWEM